MPATKHKLLRGHERHHPTIKVTSEHLGCTHYLMIKFRIINLMVDIRDVSSISDWLNG